MTSVVAVDLLERRAAGLLSTREALARLGRLAELAGEFARPPAEGEAAAGAAPLSWGPGPQPRPTPRRRARPAPTPLPRRPSVLGGRSGA